MSTTSTGARTYAIDPIHSSAHFSVRHLMISKVRGAFKKLSGTISLSDASPIPTAIDVTIDAASIDTGDAQRDGHLQSPDFFEVEKFPTLEFKSTSIGTADGDAFDVTGDLTIHGVTRPTTVRVTVAGQGKDPWGNDRIAYETSFKVNRKDHDLVWNQALEAGGVAIGEQVEVQLDVETIPKPN